MHRLSTSLWLLDNGSILDTENDRVIHHDDDKTWLLHFRSCRSGDGIMRIVQNKSELTSDLAVLPVFCTKVYKRGKTTYAMLMDRTHSFEYPINGTRKIGNTWYQFAFRMYPSSAYLLIARRKEGYPEDMYVHKHRKVGKDE